MRRTLSLGRASVTPFVKLFFLILAAAPSTSLALDLDITSNTSILTASKTILASIFTTYYNPNSNVGHFNQPEPWLWWESGSCWTAVMDYTVFTDDTTYQPALLAAIAANVGDKYDFLPASQASWEANDDQVYWLYSALTALEYNFTALSPCQGPGTGANGTCANSWLSIATNVFNVYVERWTSALGTCRGGLKWQYNTNAAGFYYKNSVTNGGFFQTAARLARYTQNTTYDKWATTIWDWSTGVGLVSPSFAVYDGAGDGGGANCSEINSVQWTYNVATYMHGAAHMYAYTGGDKVWEARVAGLVRAANSTFFQAGVMWEQQCEQQALCTPDQTSFKSSLARWLGKTAELVPSVKADIMKLLAKSAQGAAANCAVNATGGSVQCGMQWTTNGYDGHSDFGTMLSALEVVQSLLVSQAPPLANMTPSVMIPSLTIPALAGSRA